MIDLHTHILPGIDDGSPNAGTSMRMLRQMAVQGTQILCASPHYYADEQSIHEFCEKRDVAFAEFRQAGLGEYENQPIVLPAAEVAFFPGISEQKELERLCIKGTHTLLLEMPFCEWNDFQIEEVTSLSLDLGYQIVLVHPERFLFSKKQPEVVGTAPGIADWYTNQRGQFAALAKPKAGTATAAGGRVPLAWQRCAQHDDTTTKFGGGTKCD